MVTKSSVYLMRGSGVYIYDSCVVTFEISLSSFQDSSVNRLYTYYLTAFDFRQVEGLLSSLGSVTTPSFVSCCRKTLSARVNQLNVSVVSRSRACRVLPPPPPHTHTALNASRFIPGDRAPSILLIGQVAPLGGN